MAAWRNDGLDRHSPLSAVLPAHSPRRLPLPERCQRSLSFPWHLEPVAQSAVTAGARTSRVSGLNLLSSSSRARLPAPSASVEFATPCRPFFTRRPLHEFHLRALSDCSTCRLRDRQLRSPAPCSQRRGWRVPAVEARRLASEGRTHRAPLELTLRRFQQAPWRTQSAR